MKNFIAAFLGWFVGILVLLMFSGNLIFNNAYALIALIAFILAVFTILYFELAGQVEELQKRLDALEGKKCGEKDTMEEKDSEIDAGSNE